MVYLMHQDDEEDDDREAAAFENLIYASSVATQHPGLYYTIWGDGSDRSEDHDVEWVTPRSEDDLKGFFDLMDATRSE